MDHQTATVLRDHRILFHFVHHNRPEIKKKNDLNLFIWLGIGETNNLECTVQIRSTQCISVKILSSDRLSKR